MYAVKAAERTSHYRGDWHRYNVKRQVAGLPPMPLADFDLKLSALKSQQGREEQARAEHLCEVCNKTCASAAAYAQHLNSKTHLKRVMRKEQRGVMNVSQQEEGDNETVPVEQSTFSQFGEQEDDLPELEVADQANRAQKTGITYLEPQKKLVKVKRESKQEAEFEFDESKAIPLMTCLFCPRSFTTVDKSLQHMLKAHGFFVPFTEYLIDMNGLLKYLGAKVGMGRVCLWCNGTSFSDVRAIQQHMKDKGHCKLKLDDDDDEFLEFYRFPDDECLDEEDEGDEGDEGDEEEENEIKHPHPRRGMKDLNDANELVLADGSILGHREHRRIYKQNLRPETLLEAEDRMKNLRLLGGPGNGGQLVVSKAEKQKRFNEKDTMSRQHRLAVKNRLSHEFRANNMKHFVDSTGVY